MGIEPLMYIQQKLSRKISGLPVGESFTEIHHQLKDSLNSLISNCETQLSSISQTLFSEEETLLLTREKHQINELREKISTLMFFDISSDQQLGPQPFRDMPEIKSMDIKNMDTTLVVREIEIIFKHENNIFNFEEYFEKNTTSRCGTRL